MVVPDARAIPFIGTAGVFGVTQSERFDVVLVGAGIMSATLATLWSELDPDTSMLIVERLDGPAQESSDG